MADDEARERSKGLENPDRLHRERSEGMTVLGDLGRERNKKTEANGNGDNRDGEGKREERRNARNLVVRRWPWGLGRERGGEAKNPHGIDKSGGEKENPSRRLVLRGRETQFPPDDDVCAICFGDFQIPCRSDCGHWFCAGCILMLWNYSSSFLKRCKCPICCRLISELTPEASLTLQREEEVVEALKSVQRYNCLFVGGARGLIMKIHELRLFVRRFYRGLLDPGRAILNLNALHLIACWLACLYEFSGFDFIPTGCMGTVQVFDWCAIALVVILLLVGYCRRLVLAYRARHIAAPALPP